MICLSFSIGVRDYTLDNLSIIHSDGDMVFSLSTWDEDTWATLESLGCEPYTGGDGEQDWEIDLSLADGIEFSCHA